MFCVWFPTFLCIKPRSVLLLDFTHHFSIQYSTRLPSLMVLWVLFSFGGVWLDNKRKSQFNRELHNILHFCDLHTRTPFFSYVIRFNLLMGREKKNPATWILWPAFVPLKWMPVADPLRFLTTFCCFCLVNTLTLWLSTPSYGSNELRCLVNTTQPLDESLLITQTDGIVVVSGGLWCTIFSPIWLNKLSLSQRGLSVALFLLMGLSLPSILLALYEETMCVWLNSVLRAEKATAHSPCILWCLQSSVKLLCTAPLGCLLIFTWLLSAQCSAVNYVWQAYPSTSCLDMWALLLCPSGW